MFTATFISTEGEYLEAVIEINGERLHVMDEFNGKGIQPGSEIKVVLSPFIATQGEWDEVFSANLLLTRWQDAVEGPRFLKSTLVGRGTVDHADSRFLGF
ncbi:MAG TPA: hypothetical protein DF383_03920 [Deltaproteobacteria bacterium]|nr:hypothetical protein [Deltaproteobacteria bacterium]